MGDVLKGILLLLVAIFGMLALADSLHSGGTHSVGESVNNATEDMKDAVKVVVVFIVIGVLLLSGIIH